MKESEIIELIKNNDTETALKILKIYGTERKKSGAKSFAKLIQDMRRKQIDHNRNPNSGALSELKKLESRVDTSVNLILGIK